jgi:GNAT superfamily N-acetyltransferase
MLKSLDLEFLRPESRDVSFVNEMLVAACFPPGRPLPTVDAALAHSHAVRWLRPLVGAADVAVLALRNGRRVGAAVGRCFPDADPSWGVVAADVPELAMAVVPEERGRGVGQ